MIPACFVRYESFSRDFEDFDGFSRSFSPDEDR
jgi:hypothetical protein